MGKLLDIFKPAWKNNSERTRFSSEAIGDQPLLANVAVKDVYEARLTAVEKLTDQTILGKVALMDKERCVRFAG